MPVSITKRNLVIANDYLRGKEESRILIPNLKVLRELKWKKENVRRPSNIDSIAVWIEPKCSKAKSIKEYAQKGYQYVQVLSVTKCLYGWMIYFRNGKGMENAFSHIKFPSSLIY